MSFQVKNWVTLSPSGNTDIVSLQDGSLIGGPTFYGYISGTDDIATIATADYFASQAPILSVTDLIYVAATDGEIFMSVAGVSLGPPASVVVTLVTPGTGDVDGPASSVDNNIAVFNGITGKIIKDGGKSIAQIQNGSLVYAASSAGTDTYAVTLSPVPTAYADGFVVNFKADVANTGPATLNVNGLGAIAINKLHNQALTTGDIEAGQIVSVVYDSTGPKFQMQSQTAISVISGALNTVLQGQGVGSEPAYSTATYPPTTTINQLLYSSAANTVGGLATANNGTLVTGNTGAPSVLAGPGTTGNILQANAAAAPSFSTATYPSTTTASQILYSSAANTVAGLATANNGVLVTDGSGVPSIGATLPAAVVAAIPGRLASFQVLTSGTAATYTTPAGVTAILVECVGGGGGGGPTATVTGGNVSAGGGGGSGGYVRHFIDGPAATYTYTVGAGGASGAAGSPTTFDSLAASGGNPGGTGTDSATGAFIAGGGGGGASGGNITNQTGAPGAPGLALVAVSTAFGGSGAPSYLGDGAAGNGASNPAAGNAAAANSGAGGSGGHSFGNAGPYAGGAGGSGIIIVWEFT